MNSQIQAEYLRCEYLENPCGIDEPRPRLSWECHSSGRNIVQTAWHILAASTPELLAQDRGDVWDSGKVPSNQSAHIIYQGPELQPHQRLCWKVRLWDGNDEPGSWSSSATWSMGMLDQSRWQGQWIGFPSVNVPDAIYFRRRFSTRKPLARAVAYFCCRGIYQAWINGRPLGDALFQPGWTDYDRRIYYLAHEVTELLTPDGENVIAAAAGDGWYKGAIAWTGSRNNYGGSVMLLAHLRLEYTDGSVECIATDDNWRSSTGPILFNSFLMGETHDARQELGAWNSAGYDDSGWRSVRCEKLKPLPLLQAYPVQPVRRTAVLKPVRVLPSRPGSWIFDMGQNCAGFARIRLTAWPGATLRIRYGEMLDQDGNLYVENLRSALSTDHYTFASRNPETWEPQFTFHGFQYIELSGIFQDAQPPADCLEAVVVGSDTPRNGEFNCDNPMLNQLYSNIVWTQRSNFIDIPTDCPQRDERLGWTGDAQVYIRTAICNMDVAAFFKKWLVDLADTYERYGHFTDVAPCPPKVWDKPGKANAAWGDAATVCPWILYNCYGDLRILQRHYRGMLDYCRFMYETSSDGLRLHTPERNCYGDWLSVNAETPKDLILSAFYAYSTSLTMKAAALLGHKSDRLMLEHRLAHIRQAFQNRFIDQDGYIEGRSQTGYVLALAFDLVEAPELRRLLARHLVDDIEAHDNHLTTGFVGISYLLPTLVREGYLETAYRLLTNTTYPSWGYSVVNGATSIWERWNGYIAGQGFGDASMNSFAHYAYGSVGEWLFSTVAGIDTVEPGFKKIRLAPLPGAGISQAQASYRAITGLITSDWQLQNGNFTLNISIPANTSAEVLLPTAIRESVKLDGKPVNTEPCSGPLPRCRLELGSGNYSLECKISK